MELNNYQKQVICLSELRQPWNQSVFRVAGILVFQGRSRWPRRSTVL